MPTDLYADSAFSMYFLYVLSIFLCVLAVVVPIALGAAVMAGACVLKAKCTLVVSVKQCPNSTGCTGAREGKDPWAPHVDLRDDAEKRKDSQRALEAAETQSTAASKTSLVSLDPDECLQLERAMMIEQLEILYRSVEPASPLTSSERKEMRDRPLIDGPDSARATHRGLHSTGSVFVSSVDSSNASTFFWTGNTPFKAVLVTETSETPQWFKAIA